MPAPTVEIDRDAGAFYVRFRRGKVARTAEDRHETTRAMMDVSGNRIEAGPVGEVAAIHLIRLRSRHTAEMDRSQGAFQFGRIAQAYAQLKHPSPAPPPRHPS